MGLSEFSLSVISGMLGSLLIVEWVTGCDALARFLVTRAANRLPSPHRDEMLAQWLADIEDTNSPTWKLCCAISNSLRVSSVAKAHGVSLVGGLTAKNLIRHIYDTTYEAIEVFSGVIAGVSVLGFEFFLSIFYIPYKILRLIFVAFYVMYQVVMEKVTKQPNRYGRNSD